MSAHKNPKLQALTDTQIRNAVQLHGGWNAAAKALGIPAETFKNRCRAVFQGEMRSKARVKPVVLAKPRTGVKRFILSSAQTNTKVHDGFMTNLEAYAKHLGADVHIAGFAYATSTFDDGTKHSTRFDPRVLPYLTNQRFDVGGKLYFCGEMNTSPTAEDPLSGFETYTRSKWGIFPHPRVTLKSIATMFNSEPKIIMTTGTVTVPNYIQKKAGLKAEFHHVVAAVLVEIDADGDFFCRHLIADKNGGFQDLDVYVENGKVDDGYKVEAITWGDLHTERLDPKTALGAWGLSKDLLRTAEYEECMQNVLRPSVQFFHDAIDFRRRNHHNIDDPYFRYKAWINGEESVEDEIARVSAFLAAVSHEDTETIVVDSNHDRALTRWLKTANYKTDPVNAVFFLKCQAATYEAMREGDESFNVAEFAVRAFSDDLQNVHFLRNTDSYIICPHAGGGIECGLHGDEGPNGAKGSVRSYAKMGPKANVAHHHGAEILEGIYQAGHSCMRDMVYNRGGLTSWNPSHIITYPNGKRIIVTMRGSKWRA